MKKLLLPLFACCSLWAQADDAPLWLRYPALSPDGREIAFTSKVTSILCLSKADGRCN